MQWAREAAPIDISRLENDIRTRIDECDFAIADISERNPNVLVEVGLALGSQKPVVLLSRKGCEIPVDLQGRLCCEYESIDADSLVDRLAPFLAAAVKKAVATRDDRKFRLTGYAKRQNVEFSGLLRGAGQLARVNTSNLKWFVTEGLLDDLCSRLNERKRLRVSILALDPDSEYALERARQLGRLPKSFRQELRSSLESVVAALRPFEGRCQVASFNEHPTQIALFVDGRVFYGVVTSHRRARENVVVELPLSQQNVDESFSGHFKAVWGRAEVLLGPRGCFAYEGVLHPRPRKATGDSKKS